jgi:phosphate transport system protein
MEVDKMTIHLLAMRQPMARDLRFVVASLKMASDFERIADYAANVAKNVRYLEDAGASGDATPDAPVDAILEMAGLATIMLEGVIEAYRDLDAEKSVEIWKSDAVINKRYEELIGRLRNIMGERCENAQAPTALLFMGRCCERIGDHVKNAAEHIYYIATGRVHIMENIEEQE